MRRGRQTERDRDRDKDRDRERERETETETERDRRPKKIYDSSWCVVVVVVVVVAVMAAAKWYCAARVLTGFNIIAANCHFMFCKEVNGNIPTPDSVYIKYLSQGQYTNSVNSEANEKLTWRRHSLTNLTSTIMLQGLGKRKVFCDFLFII